MNNLRTQHSNKWINASFFARVCFDRMSTSTMASVLARKGFKEWPGGLMITTFNKHAAVSHTRLPQDDTADPTPV